MSLSQLHKPVLLSEVLKAFHEHFDKDQKFFGVDATFGRGGHYQALREDFQNMITLGLDQDLEAINYAEDQFKKDIESQKLDVKHLNFSSEKVLEAIGGKSLQFVFMDIGVSSPQLDNAERGFSFYNDGPLDMRMNQSLDQTAADVLNETPEEELKEIFLNLGEVYPPKRLMEMILSYRSEKPFETTLDFANLVEKACGWRKKGSHPATLYFQALRIYVNKELESLEKALKMYTEALCAGGVFVVISFHSLEDRIVKRFFKSSALGKPVNKKVIKPTREEEKSNVRARSAKLRVFKKFEPSEVSHG